MGRRTGKVARLPYEARTAVNTMLRDGWTYHAIIDWLKDQKHGDDWNEQNLSNWKEGGFLDWTREQERLEDMKVKREFAFEIVKQNEGSTVHEAALQVAASQMYEMLADFELASLKEVLAEKPQLYPKIIGSIAKISQQALGFEKFKENVRDRKAAIAKEIEAGKATGITAETIARIEQELKLL